MKEKIEILLSTLGDALAGATLEHKHADACHQFSLRLPGATHRADFPDDVIASKDVAHLKRLCKQVVALLRNNPGGKPRHLIVKGDGIHEGF